MTSTAVEEADGYLRGVSLPSVLQIISSEQKSCGLEVTGSAGQAGVLHFRKGEIVDAELGDERGLPAAHSMVLWQRVDVRVLPPRINVVQSIHASVQEVLLEGHRLADERSRGEPAEVGEADPDDALGVGTVHDDTTEKEGRLSLQQMLERFSAEVPHFVSTDIVDTESGLSIGGVTADATFDAAAAAASYAEVIKASQQTSQLLGFGRESTEDILITLRDVYVLLRMLGPDYYQGLAVNRAGNLGLARALMKKYQRSFFQFLGGLRAVT